MIYYSTMRLLVTNTKEEQQMNKCELIVHHINFTPTYRGVWSHTLCPAHSTIEDRALLCIITIIYTEEVGCCGLAWSMVFVLTVTGIVLSREKPCLSDNCGILKPKISRKHFFFFSNTDSL